jgi:hypothetical protein
MTELRLHILPEAYEMSLDGKTLAALPEGASALLRGSGARLREIDIERLIEAAEDWIMPTSKSLQHLKLRVHDATGRLSHALEAQMLWTPSEVEVAFDRVFHAVGHGEDVDRESAADIVLLRELVHHGRLVSVAVD